MIVLDTHAWLWWVSGSEALSAPARQAIERQVAQRTIHVSSISAWEVALLMNLETQATRTHYGCRGLDCKV